MSHVPKVVVRSRSIPRRKKERKEIRKKRFPTRVIGVVFAVILLVGFSRRFGADPFPVRFFYRGSCVESEGVGFNNPLFDADGESYRTIFSSTGRKGETRPERETDRRRPVTADDWNRLRTVRIAFWNLYPADYAKVTDPEIGGRIAEIIADFDLVALAGFRAGNPGVADGLLFRVNRLGKRFDYLVPPLSGDGEFNAFFFNRDRIAVDRSGLTRLTDSAGRLPAPALAAPFCAAGMNPTERFTFVVSVLRIDPKRSGPEPNLLADLFREVRDRSGRGGIPEDDLLFLGSFEVPIDRLGTITEIPNLVSVASGIPTDLHGRSVDHFIFDQRSTTEYVERFGIVNLSSRFNIPPEEASRIADHYPIWADFTAKENF